MTTLIFDLDGTLLDSRKRHTVLLRDVCRELSVGLTEDRFAAYLPSKRDGMNTLSYLTGCCGIEEETARGCAALWTERIEQENYLGLDEPYPDIEEVRRWITGMDEFRCVLITARRREDLMLKQLRRWELTELFGEIHCVSPEKAKNGKAEIARKLPGKAIWIGDTEADQYGADTCEIPFYALYNGFRSKTYWSNRGVVSYPDVSTVLRLFV